jgi:S1-C subfamily serine protease
MNPSMRFPRILLIAACLVASAAVAPAQSISESAREVYQNYQDALVVVTARCQIEFTTDSGSLPDQEQNTQTLGTIIHPRGLVLVSNSALDLSVGMVGQKGRAAGSEAFLTVTKADASFPEIQINLADGSEYNATRIQQNKEMDIAFLLINAKQVAERKVPLVAVDLSKKVSENGLSIADPVVGLSRSSSVYRHIPTVMPGYVTAISRRPEATYYITSAGISQGVPVFDLDGRFAGLTVQRIVGDQRTNVLGTLAAGVITSLADLAKAKAGLK